MIVTVHVACNTQKQSNKRSSVNQEDDEDNRVDREGAVLLLARVMIAQLEDPQGHSTRLFPSYVFPFVPPFVPSLSLLSFNATHPDVAGRLYKGEITRGVLDGYKVELVEGEHKAWSSTHSIRKDEDQDSALVPDGEKSDREDAHVVTVDETDRTETRCHNAAGCLGCGVLLLVILFVLWWVLGAFKSSAGDFLRDVYEGITGNELTCEDLFALFLAALLGALLACCYCCCIVFWCCGRKDATYHRFEDDDVSKVPDAFLIRPHPTCIWHVSTIVGLPIRR